MEAGLGATSFTLIGIHFTADLEDIVEINYNLQIPKIKKTVEKKNSNSHWSHHCSKKSHYTKS